MGQGAPVFLSPEGVQGIPFFPAEILNSVLQPALHSWNVLAGVLRGGPLRGLRQPQPVQRDFVSCSFERIPSASWQFQHPCPARMAPRSSASVRRANQLCPGAALFHLVNEPVRPRTVSLVSLSQESPNTLADPCHPQHPPELDSRETWLYQLP